MSLLTSSPSRNRAIWDCALECALRRKTSHRCPHKFDDKACWGCKFFIRKYIKTDEASLKLYMLQAEKEAYKCKVEQNGRTKFWVGIVVAIILVVIWHKVDNDHTRKSMNEFVQNANASKAANFPANNDTEKTLHHVARALRKNTDVNGDKKINCIDAAVLFYQYYPDKDKVCIESNNPMEHLFNCVLINGDWRAIEPQAYWQGHRNYFMKDIWGGEYDPKFNQDVTENFKKYVK